MADADAAVGGELLGQLAHALIRFRRSLFGHSRFAYGQRGKTFGTVLLVGRNDLLALALVDAGALAGQSDVPQFLRQRQHAQADLEKTLSGARGVCPFVVLLNRGKPRIYRQPLPRGHPGHLASSRLGTPTIRCPGAVCRQRPSVRSSPAKLTSFIDRPTNHRTAGYGPNTSSTSARSATCRACAAAMPAAAVPSRSRAGHRCQRCRRRSGSAPSAGERKHGVIAAAYAGRNLHLCLIFGPPSQILASASVTSLLDSTARYCSSASPSRNTIP